MTAIPDELQDLYRRLADSGLFDAHFYRHRYPDVAASGQDPLLHFLSAGELRQPGPDFDPLAYWADNPDVLAAGLPPLTHYVLYGKDERRLLRPARAPAPAPVAPGNEQWRTLLARLAPRLSPAEPRAQVIVPVYLGHAESLNCLYNLTQSRLRCRSDCLVTVVDDCSPDQELSRSLRQLHEAGCFQLIRHEENQGFVASVNRGMALYPDLDALVLNADTEVYGDWLDRLSAAAHAAPRTATATPFSNNATICGYPLFGRDFPFAYGPPFAEIDSLAAGANAGLRADIPTGVGFCLYLRRDALAELGGFDQQRFGHGYGEENDFCRRAADKGWSNVLAADVFVRHLGSVSFSDSRTQRVRKARAVLAALHPGYEGEIAAFCRADPLSPLRRNIDAALVARSTAGGGLLLIGDRKGLRQIFSSCGPKDALAVLNEAFLDFAFPCLGWPSELSRFDLSQGSQALGDQLSALGFCILRVLEGTVLSDDMQRFLQAAARQGGLDFKSLRWTPLPSG